MGGGGGAGPPAAAELCCPSRGAYEGECGDGPLVEAGDGRASCGGFMMDGDELVVGVKCSSLSSSFGR